MSTPRTMHRLTALYDCAEDRIHMAAELDDQQRVRLLLTRRLLERLVPVLLGQLVQPQAAVSGDVKVDAAGRAAPVFQEFAQQRARLVQPRVAPVALDGSVFSVLVTGVSLRRASDALTLVFRGEQGEPLALPLVPLQLRQWLNILYDLHVKAGWPLDIWPDWMRQTRLGMLRATGSSVLH